MYRHYSLIDRLISHLDNGLQAVSGNYQTQRPSPAQTLSEPTLSTAARKHSAGLMRVNHSGEVCAQALYQAQALVARNRSVRETLQQSGQEENDHLAWCHQRLQELNSHRSYLNPWWYWNSFLIGLIAGIAGDHWSLGFVEETEIQVSKHLQSHLNQVDANDIKSRSVIRQMQEDEERHAENARQQGAQPLPAPIKAVMALHAKVMTTLAYWL